MPVGVAGQAGRRSRPASAPTTTASCRSSATCHGSGSASSQEDIERLDGQIDHFFHLAAIYDLTADADSQFVANVEGTRHALHLAGAVHAGHFHMMSSIAAAGLYRGTFTEDMFEEAQDVEHNPYYHTKHEAERVVRAESPVPWRVYRPGAVVGHSETGEIDKIDGPYYFFKSLQRLRGVMPSWARGIGIEGGEINIVPVDYVAKAMDYIAHQPDLDGQAFHLTDPEPLTVGGLFKALTKAAKAPQPTINLDARALDMLPARLTSTLTRLPGAKQLTDLALAELGIPRESFQYLTYPTHFDSSEDAGRCSRAPTSRCRRSRCTPRTSGSTGSGRTARTAARTSSWRGPSRARR